MVNKQGATISSHFLEHSKAANVFFLSSTYIPKTLPSRQILVVLELVQSKIDHTCGMYVDLKKKTLAAMLCSTKWEEIVARWLFTTHGSLSLSYFSSLHQTFVSCFYQLRGGGSWNAIWAALTRTLLSLSLLLSARLCTVVENGLNPPKISSSQLISPEYRGLSRAWVRNLKLRVPLIT